MAYSVAQRIPSPPDWHAAFTTVGVTGTDGKTSTVAMLAAVLGTVCTPVARVTSIGAFVGDEELDVPRGYAGLLTAMRRSRGRGGRFSVVEWASWSLANGFLASWPPQIGVVTNVTGDHLDYHGSFESYVASKARLVRCIRGDGFVVLNSDCPGTRSLEEHVQRDVRTLRYAREGSRACASADVGIIASTTGWSGTKAELRLRDGTVSTLCLRMIGHHFVENAAAAMACALGLGIDPTLAAHAIDGVVAPPGRFELVARRPRVVVDFAHTANALTRTLETARELCVGRLTTVVGAGGNRDPAKRPALGKAAAVADHIILTSDNPRHEDPKAIITEIRRGIPDRAHVVEEVNRAVAIHRAILAAEDDDVVVIAGRGRDTHQQVGDEWIPMDDAALAVRALRERG